MSTIIFDTETTGLPRALGTELNLQPYITEIYAIKVDDEMQLEEKFHSLIKIPIPVPEFITKITGISDMTLKGAPLFIQLVKELTDFFFGVETVVGHNLIFDMKMLIIELTRHGEEFKFPYPPNRFCTMEQSMHIKGHRLKNGELYKIATGKELQDAHRAENDVNATFESFKYLKG